MIRELWRFKKLYSTNYPIAGANATAPIASLPPIELTKYAQEDFFGRLIVRLSGNITVVGAAPGAATGRENPEALLVSANLTTTPQLNGMNPITNVSSRGILYDSAFMRGYVIKGTALTDAAGVQAVDTLYEFYFKRPNVRKGVEWSHSIAKYSSDLLQLQFGGRDQLFTGGTPPTWDMSGLTVSVYVSSDFAVDTDRNHNHEFFERTFPIVATQTDFPIDTLPQGFLYTDLTFLAEEANVLTNAIINNINLEGGGRVWLPQGEQNANVIRRAHALYRGQISDAAYVSTGVYPIPLRDGMFTRGIDALTAPITIKLDVTAGAASVVRLVGRRMVPGRSLKSNPGAAGAKPAVTGRRGLQ